MFHVKQALLFFCLMSVFFASAQQGAQYFYSPVNFNVVLKEDTSIRNALHQSSDFKDLTVFDQSLFYALNYARKYPKQFSKEALEPYLRAYPDLKPEYGESLKSELELMRPAAILQTEPRLLKIARAHASDIASHNLMSHKSSNGISTQERFTKEGINCGSECINMASSFSPLEVILSLLVDYKVPGLGHRRSLLNPAMSYVGAGVATSTGSQKVQYTVIDLGCF